MSGEYVHDQPFCLGGGELNQQAALKKRIPETVVGVNDGSESRARRVRGGAFEW